MVLFYDHTPDPSSTPSEANTDDHRSLVRKIHIFTIQGHPEFHASIMSKLIENRARRGILSQDVAADAKARNALEAVGGGYQRRIEEEGTGNERMNDGLEVGEVIWEMLGL
jgi:hypothetical protein